jgi:hypothetical protein
MESTPWLPSTHNCLRQSGLIVMSILLTRIRIGVLLRHKSKTMVQSTRVMLYTGTGTALFEATGMCKIF